MKSLKTIFSLSIILVFVITNCGHSNSTIMGRKESKYANYLELSEHAGSPNYEVLSLVKKEHKASYVHFDIEREFLYVNSYDKVSEPVDYKCFRINSVGTILDTNDINPILADGTMERIDFYQNWIIDDDKTKRKFYFPLNEFETKDYNEWLVRFDELYGRSEMVHRKKSFGYFLMRMDDRVFFVDSPHIEFLEVEDNYPDKGKKRMIKLPDLTPDFLSRKERLENTSLMEYITYEQVESEPGEGFNPIGFSGGYHYIDLHMPGGDTIKFKRYGSMGVNIKTYKIPAEYGGRDDVIFIHQQINPNPALVNGREWGGMYVVRPRGLGVGE